MGGRVHVSNVALRQTDRQTRHKTATSSSTGKE